MPNHRDTTVRSADLEKANPFPPGRFAEAESQETRGLPGSRGRGNPVPPRSRSGDEKQSTHRYGPKSWSGVNPLPPIDPSMPALKPGDQGG